MIRLVVVLLLGSSFALAEVPAHDANLEKIAKDLQIAKANLEIQELKQKKVLTALYSINKNMKKLVTEKADLEEQRNLTELQIQGLNDKIEDNNKQTALQRAQLTDRLRT